MSKRIQPRVGDILNYPIYFPDNSAYRRRSIRRHGMRNPFNQNELRIYILNDEDIGLTQME